MLEIDQASRISADLCLTHPWFTWFEDAGVSTPPVPQKTTTEEQATPSQEPSTLVSYASGGIRRLTSMFSSGEYGLDALDGSDTKRPCYRTAEVNQLLRPVRAANVDMLPPFVSRQSRFGE